MERRDIIKDQIEQLGKVLGKILANFLGLKSLGLDNAIETSNEQLKNELDIDIKELLEDSLESQNKYLAAKGLTADHLEILSDYLMTVGQSKINQDNSVAKKYLMTSINLLDLADKFSNTFSLARMDKRTKIENMLQQGI